MPEADVIVAWGHGPVPESAKAAFTRPTRFLTLPNPNWKEPLSAFGYPSPLRSILKKYAPDVTPRRVATLGFSASCQGLAALLASPDGGWFDAAVAIDGIHTGKPVGLPAMAPWFEFAKRAFVNERLMIVTHSSVVPPGYASTTETADWLWKTLNGGDQAAFTDPPVPDLSIPPRKINVPAGPATGPARSVEYPTAPNKPPRRRAGLVILGYQNLDVPRGTADHIYQAQAVMPMVLVRLLSARWNAIDPKSPESVCFVG